MNIPSNNSGVAPTDLPASSSSLYELSPEKKDNAKKALAAYEETLATAYENMGLGAADAKSGSPHHPQAPTLEEPTGVINPAQIIAMLSNLNADQSATDMNTSIGMAQNNLSKEHTGVEEQIAADQKP